MKYEIFLWLGTHTSFSIWALSSRLEQGRQCHNQRNLFPFCYALGGLTSRKDEKTGGSSLGIWNIFIISSFQEWFIDSFFSLKPFLLRRHILYWSLGRGVERERDITIALFSDSLFAFFWNLFRTGWFIPKLSDMIRRKDRHSQSDCSVLVLFRPLV